VFVDRARIQVIAGRGGRGAISFRREKYVPKGGPDGGDGGKGASVWLEVDAHIRTLLDCREQRRYRADNGRQGEGNNRTGRDGEDIVVHLPPGTVVRDAGSGDLLADLVSPGDRFLAARGGRGGRGNARFATPTHQTPRKADPGEEGEERELELELKLIADVGLVGAPNAGKSTMLAAITRARPKIGAYPFTTLEPNLGIVALDEERQFVVADVPGLIEGAHQGKGLGIQFLRHVERCRVLAVLVDVTVENPGQQLTEVERELVAYHPALGEKPRLLVLTKSDLLPPEARGPAAAAAGMSDALVVSAHSGEGMRELRERLWRLVEANLPSRSES
jgi:GTP-binding protein